MESSMSIGVYREVVNTDRKFGTHPTYLFLKVQSGTKEEDEEYWLVTPNEAQEFASRAERNVEDWVKDKKGSLSKVDNAEHKFGEQLVYFHVLVKPRRKDAVHWLLTETDLATLRERTANNDEDIEANREGWMADLFD